MEVSLLRVGVQEGAHVPERPGSMPAGLAADTVGLVSAESREGSDGAAAAEGSCLAGKPGNENKRRDLDVWKLAFSHPQTSGAVNFRPGKQDSKTEALGLAGEGEPHLSYTGPTRPGSIYRSQGPCPGLSSE